MPTLICVGQVNSDDVGEAKVSESGQYIVQPIKISALGAGKSHTVYFLYRPEWFNPDFRPDQLKQQEGGESAHFVYAKNINARGSISTLKGLAGSQKAFDRLAGMVLSLGGEPTMAQVTETLKSFFETNINNETGSPALIGYVLTQQQTRTDEKDEAGKTIKILENRYEVGNFFEVSEKTLAKYRKAAEGSNGTKKLTYAGEPF